MSFTDLVQATKAALLLDPAQAVAKFEAHHDLVGPCEVTVKVGSGHKFTVDELEALGASNMAANPVEYALAALGSCQAITYRVWAAQLDVKLDKVAIGIDGDIDLRGFFRHRRPYPGGLQCGSHPCPSKRTRAPCSL